MPKLTRRKMTLTLATLVVVALAAAAHDHASSSLAELPHAAVGGKLSDLRINYAGTEKGGVKVYRMASPYDGPGPQTLRVLPPLHPAPGLPHNILLVLPSEVGLLTRTAYGNFGDGLTTLQKLDAENRYNLTIVEPTFSFAPWYTDDPTATDRHYETFLAKQLAPWISAHLAKSKSDQIWLMGYSKAGLGAQDLLLKHPSVFSLAASWDFPAAMTSYTEYGAVGYGSQANFATHYELSQDFIAAQRRPFLTANRIWIGGYFAFEPDVIAYDRLLTREGVKHTLGPMKKRSHTWFSGWMPAALAALHSDSVALARERHLASARASTVHGTT